MLGKGKSSGLVNEASNLLANQNLTKAAEYMQTAEYQKSRDLDDVIPTARHLVPKAPAKDPNRHLKVFNPEEEKLADKMERQVDDEEDEDDELERLREMRRSHAKQENDRMVEYRQKQHGSYREISETDFFSTVVREKGGSENVALHFYHKDFERCKIMDQRLQDLAPEMMNVKFCKINVEKAPFLIERLKVNVLPCVLIFQKDIAVDRIVGFEDMGIETIDDDLLRVRIKEALKMDPNL